MANNESLRQVLGSTEKDQLLDRACCLCIRETVGASSLSGDRNSDSTLQAFSFLRKGTSKGRNGSKFRQKWALLSKQENNFHSRGQPSLHRGLCKH